MSVDVMMLDGAAQLENAEMDLDAPTDFTEEAMQQDEASADSTPAPIPASVSFEPAEASIQVLEHEMTPVEETPTATLEDQPESVLEDPPVESVPELAETSAAPTEEPRPGQIEETETPSAQAEIPLPPIESSQVAPPESRDEAEDAVEAPAAEVSVPQDAEPDEPDELEDGSREGTPELDALDDSSSRPVPMLEYLGNVTMPAIPDATATDTSSDTAIKAPPMKLSYLNETFWLFAEDADEHATPLASTSTSHHPTGVHPVLLGQPDDHRLYYVALESVFARLHESFPSFADDEMEMVLCMPHDYGIEIGEVRPAHASSL
jgi:hypothetical protein